jgi:uncharacterized ferritin-like protein (DUF455 family)
VTDVAGAGHAIGGAPAPNDLVSFARAIVVDADPASKVSLAREAARRLREGSLSFGPVSAPVAMPDRPGRPERPELLAPRDMPRRSAGDERGRFALMHAIAHIELNAVDMAWDLVGRFAHEDMPGAFLSDWAKVGAEEAQHFALVSARLGVLGGRYGDLPAHDGLWQSAQATGHDLLARLAVVPLVLEARGLDVTPGMIAQLQAAGDDQSAAVLGVILRDEQGHVACGLRWFRFVCAQRGLAPEPTFQALVRAHFKGTIRPPFNEAARGRAGLEPAFYKPLTVFGRRQ